MLNLTGHQPIQIVTYRKGDFFRPHIDNGGSPKAPEHVSERKISTVVFLNSQTRFPEPGTFCGGSLAIRS